MNNKIALVESSLYGENTFKVANIHEMQLKAKQYDSDFNFITPVELAVKSHQTIPSGLPIRSVAFIVDKMAVAVCDGEDHWYREADKPVDAGQPWSAMF